MQIGQIAGPDALYGASVFALTFEAGGEAIINPIDFDEHVDVNSTKAIENITHRHILVSGESRLGFSQNVNRSDFLTR